MQELMKDATKHVIIPNVQKLNWGKVLLRAERLLEERKRHFAANYSQSISYSSVEGYFNRMELLIAALTNIPHLNTYSFCDVSQLSTLIEINYKYKTEKLELYLLCLGLHSTSRSLLSMMKVDSPIFFKQIESSHQHTMLTLLD